MNKRKLLNEVDYGVVHLDSTELTSTRPLGRPTASVGEMF